MSEHPWTQLSRLHLRIMDPRILVQNVILQKKISVLNAQPKFQITEKQKLHFPMNVYAKQGFMMMEVASKLLV